MTISNKIKWVLGILIIFVLIIATNLIDRNNFVRVRDSAVTIYEDRLVANDLIFEMSRAVQEKEVALAKSDTTFFTDRNNQSNKELKAAITKFQQTKLTLEESKVFENLKINLNSLQSSEKEFIASKFETKSAFTTNISKVKENLYDLSKIQLNEGGRQMSISRKAIDTVELFTQMEIYLLIFLAIVIQIIVIYDPKKKSN